MGQINLQFHARRKETELSESSMGGVSDDTIDALW